MRLEVRPIVVIWGTAARAMPDTIDRSDVTFVAGPHLKAWLQGLAGDHVDREQAHDLLQRLKAFRDRNQ